MASASTNIRINISDHLNQEKKSKLEYLKEILNDYNDQQCYDILEANLWSIEACVENLSRPQRQNVASVIDSTSVVSSSEHKRHKRILPDFIRNEVQIPELRESIICFPFISAELHPWLFTAAVWTSKPVHLALSTLNVVIKFLLFPLAMWRHTDEYSVQMLTVLEENLIEILSSSYLVPNPDSGAVSLFLGSFEEAVAQAKHDFKFLLVYLHRINNSSAESFLYNSLLSPGVVHLLNDPDNVLVWAGSLGSPEGVEVHELFLSPPEYQQPAATGNFIGRFPLLWMFQQPAAPFLLALFTVTNGTAVSASPGVPASSSTGSSASVKLACIGQLEKTLSADQLRDTVAGWLDIGARPRLVARRDKSLREAVQSLRRVQEAAFEAVLSEDERREARQQADQDEQSALSLCKEDLLHKLTQMMDTDMAAHQQQQQQLQTGQGDHDIVQLRVRMQNGRRFQWLFRTDLSVKYLYQVVYAQDDAPSQFELLWGYPQRLLLETTWTQQGALPPQLLLEADIDDPPSFRTLGLLNNQVVLVRDLDQ